MTEGLEGFYHVGTIMEHGWKADLYPTLKDHKVLSLQCLS